MNLLRFGLVTMMVGAFAACEQTGDAGLALDAGVDATSDADSADLGLVDSGPPDLGVDMMMSMPDAGPDMVDLDGAVDPCGGRCSATETCCIEGFLGECEELAEGEACPMPDLTVLPETVTETLSVTWEYFPPTHCAIVEGCVGAPGWRRLMRFATQTPNVGDADLRLGAPSAEDPRFEYSSCHEHFHFLGYADYQLNNSEGAEVGHGHKQAFCLLDSQRYVDEPMTPTREMYSCDYQGIQRGWSDVYTANLDCQWVDVTDLPAGSYSLRLSINYNRVIPEASYDNNVIDVPVEVPVEEPVTPLTPCTEEREGAGRECGWTMAQHNICTPGTMIELGCGSRCGLGTCGGDPMVRVCAGDGDCGAREAVTTDDDSCGRQCPMATFVCPDSGDYTVLTAPYRTTDEYACTVMHRDVTEM